jgi:hypothetical protein
MFLLEPRSAASGSCPVLRKDRLEVFGKLRSATTIPDVAECRSWSSGNSSHNLAIVMGLGPWFCIRGVTYGHTINIENIVKRRMILEHILLV